MGIGYAATYEVHGTMGFTFDPECDSYILIYSKKSWTAELLAVRCSYSHDSLMFAKGAVTE